MRLLSPCPAPEQEMAAFFGRGRILRCKRPVQMSDTGCSWSWAGRAGGTTDTDNSNLPWGHTCPWRGAGKCLILQSAVGEPRRPGRGRKRSANPWAAVTASSSSLWQGSFEMLPVKAAQTLLTPDRQTDCVYGILSVLGLVVKTNRIILARD